MGGSGVYIRRGMRMPCSGKERKGNCADGMREFYFLDAEDGWYLWEEVNPGVLYGPFETVEDMLLGLDDVLSGKPVEQWVVQDPDMMVLTKVVEA